MKMPEQLVKSLQCTSDELTVLEHALFRFMNWSRVTDSQMLTAKSIRARVSELLVREKDV